MNAFLDHLRKLRPDYSDASDLELASAYAESVGIDKPTVFSALGIKNHSDAGWEYEAGKSHYLAGMGHIAGALGSDAAKNYAKRMTEQGDIERSMSSAPNSFDEMKFGENFLPYARQGLMGSLPYLGEAAAWGVADGLTGGAMTPALLARLGARGGVEAASRGFVESAASKAYADAMRAGAKAGASEEVTRQAAVHAAQEAAELAQRRVTSGIGMTGATYPSSVGDVLGNQQEENGTYNAPAAFALGVPYSALNLLGGEGMIARGLPGLAKGGVRRGLMAAGEVMGGEAVNETGQEFMNQFGRMAVNPNQTFWNDGSEKRFKESAIMGGLMGLGFGGGHIASSALTRNQIDPQGQRSTDLLSHYQDEANKAGDAYVNNLVTGLQQMPAEPASAEPNPFEAYLQHLQSQQRSRDALDSYPTVPPSQHLKANAFSPYPGLVDQTAGPALQQQMLAEEEGWTNPGVTEEPAPTTPTAAQQARTQKNNAKVEKAQQKQNEDNVRSQVLKRQVEALTRLKEDGVISQQQYDVYAIDVAAGKTAKLAKAIDKHLAEQNAPEAKKDKALPKTPEQRLKDKANAAKAAKTTVPEVQEEAQSEQPVQDDAARNLAIKLLSSIPSGRKSRVTGKPVDFGGMLTTYFGFDGDNDSKLEAVAKAHGLEDRQSAWSNVKSGLSKLEAAAAKIGLTSDQALEAVRALAVSRKSDLEMTDDQMEIAKLAGSMDQAVESENQGTLSYEDAMQQGMLHRQLVADPTTKPVGDATEKFETTERDHVAVNKTPVDKLLQTGASSVAEPENMSSVRSKDAVEKGKTVEQVKAERAAAEQAAKDAADSPLEETTRGVTANPTYAHKPEEYAATKDDYEYAAERLARDGQTLPSWDTLDQQAKDELTQLYKSETNNPTGRVNERRLESMYAYYTDEAAKRAASESNSQPGPTQAAEQRVPESGKRVPAKAKRKPKSAKAKPKAAPVAKNEGLEPFWASAWDEQIAPTLGVMWKGLNDSQRAHLLSAGMDEEAQERAVQAVQREIQGTITSDEAGFGNDTNEDDVSKLEGGAKYSEGKSSGTTVAAVRSTLNKLFFSPAKLNNVVEIYATQAEAVAAGAFSQTNSKVKGFTTNDGKVGLIAENIPAGKELGVALHEIGVHLGMEKLIGAANMKWLADRIDAWRQKNDGSVESRVAKWAYDKALSSTSGSEHTQEELIAYMVEGLVNEGIDPQAAKGEVKTWLVRMLNALKSALRKLGMKNPNFSGQDLVDLAYGAAHKELTGEQSASTEGSIKFSQSSYAPTIEEFQKQTNEQVKTTLKSALTTLKDYSNAALHKVVFTHDLIGIAVKAGLKSTENLDKLLGAKDVIRNQFENKVSHILDKVSELEDMNVAERFIHDSTMSQLWGYDDNPHKAPADPALKKRFIALSEKAQASVREIFNHGEETYKQVQALALAEVNREYDAMVKRAKNPDRIAQLEADRQKQLKRAAKAFPKLQGPYAPLKRFGDHVVVAKSAEYLAAEKAGDTKRMDELTADRKHVHRYVGFFNTAGAAQQQAERLKGMFPSSESFHKQMAFKHINELPWEGMAKVKLAIENDPNFAAKEKTKQLVTDLYLRMLAESSARKSEMPRKAVMGAGDMFRAFAAQGRANAHLIASLSKASEINRQFSDMQNEAANELDAAKRDKMNQVYNEIAARYAQGLDYRESPLIDKAMRVTSLWMLLSSPSYYLTNATQTYMVAMPVLGGKYGGRAFSEINRAYGDIVKAVKSMKHELDIDAMPISKDEKRMLHSLKDSGKLDITIASELGHWAEGTAEQGRVGKALFKLNETVAKVEALNRISTALASYRLSAADENATHDSRTEYASNMVDQTQGNYAGNNAPRFFNKTGAHKLLTQFRKYQLIQLSLLGRLLHTAFKGDSTEERMAAAKGFAWMFAQQMVFTGIKGAPIPAVVLMLMSALGDDDKDWERNLRKSVGDPDTALLLSRGLPAWLGLDVSGRIGMGSAFSVLPFTDVDFSKKGYKEAVFGMAGATIGGVGGSVFDGVDKMRQGRYYEGVAAMLPRGLKDVLMGMRTVTEGIKDSHGASVLSADEVSVFAGAMKAAGLPTTTLTEFQHKRGDLIELSKHFDERETRLKTDYANKDISLGEASVEWREIQESKRRWKEEMKSRGVTNDKVMTSLKPSPVSDLAKYPSKRKDRELAK